MKITAAVFACLALATAALAAPRWEVAGVYGTSRGLGSMRSHSGGTLAAEAVVGPWLFRADFGIMDSPKVETGDGWVLSGSIAALRGVRTGQHVTPWVGIRGGLARQQTSLWAKSASSVHLGTGAAWRTGRAGIWYQMPDSTRYRTSAWILELRQDLSSGLFFGASVAIADFTVGHGERYTLSLGWRFVKPEDRPGPRRETRRQGRHSRSRR